MRAVLMFIGIVMCAAGMPALADEAVLPRAVIPFTGMLDFKAPKIVLTLGVEKADGTGSVTLEVARPAAGRYDLKADIRHVDTLLGDAAAVLNGRFDLLGADPLRRELSGELATRYTLLNYKPVRDVSVKFTVRDRRLVVDPLLFGALSGRIQVALTGSHDVDAALDLISADLDALWAMLGRQGMKTPPCSGIVTGSLLLKGPWAKPLVSGRLAVYNGRWKDFGYASLDLRFEGAYPLIRFEDGKLVSSDGPAFKIAGAVDLSDLGRLGSQIQQLKHEFIVGDDGSGRTRTFRLNVSDGHATRLKSFLSGNADGRNQGEQIIGLEKQIGF